MTKSEIEAQLKNLLVQLEAAPNIGSEWKQTAFFLDDKSDAFQVLGYFLRVETNDVMIVFKSIPHHMIWHCPVSKWQGIYTEVKK